MCTSSANVAIHGRRCLWAPTTWAVLPGELQPAVGVKRCGILEVGLSPEHSVSVRHVEPPGLSQHTLIRDVPSPYRL